MKRSLSLAAVILLAVLTRLLPHPPNFAPITAMAVFAGIIYTSRHSATLVPLAALFLSDLIREVLYRYGLSTTWGLYSGIWTVYTTTALIALLGRSMRKTRSVNTIAMVTLTGSCLFFLVTNFAVWAEGSLYPRTLQGLGECYTAALPFFRNSLLGDFAYVGVLFGLWALAEARLPVLRRAPALAA